MENVLEISELYVEYKVRDIFDMLRGSKKTVAVNKISLDVKKGEVFSILGLNGAGKTTLMKCVMGLQKYSGSIEILGEKVFSKKLSSKISYLPEISYFPKEVKLKDLMFFYSGLYGLKEGSIEKINNIVDRVGLTGKLDTKLEKFSKGMLQRVGIAQAILNDPEIIFFDEPMSGLDPKGRHMVFSIIEDFKRNGKTVFLNTHILTDVEKISDRIAILHKGEIILNENVSKFKNNLEDFFIEKIDSLQN